MKTNWTKPNIPAGIPYKARIIPHKDAQLIEALTIKN